MVNVINDSQTGSHNVKMTARDKQVFDIVIAQRVAWYAEGSDYYTEFRADNNWVAEDLLGRGQATAGQRRAMGRTLTRLTRMGLFIESGGYGKNRESLYEFSRIGEELAGFVPERESSASRLAAHRSRSEKASASPTPEL